MPGLMHAARQEIRAAILEAMGRCVAEGLLPAEPVPGFSVEVPGNRRHGDFASNVAMVSSGAFRMPPRKIAETILSRLELSETCIGKAEAAGPGFLNFFLSPSWYVDVLSAITQEGAHMPVQTGRGVPENTPADAVRFFINLRENFAAGNPPRNSVYYAQCAHAHICGILKNLKAEGIAPRGCTGEELALLGTSEERELIRRLAMLSEELDNAARAYDPALITRYVLELAAKFYRFYNACRVRGEDEPLMQARLTLCVCVRDTIKNVLDLLKIDAPETM